MSIETIVRTCNKQAMEHLCANNYEECYRLLKRAEEIINSPSYPTDSKLSAVTLNNLGCYYKRINSYDLALKYLQKALAEDKENDHMTTAGTHLNILAVLSQQKSHKQALTHGIQALKLLRNSNNINTLIIALQSTGDEYSALGNNEKAMATYKYGLDLAQEHLGPSHEYTQALQKKCNFEKPEKKFYFEKLNKRATKQIFSNFRNYSVLPKISAPMRPSKSVERSPAPKDLKRSRNMRSDRTYVKTASTQQKQMLPPRKSKGSDDRMAVDGSYLKLEEKINSLQLQLENFEMRYKQFERLAKTRGRKNRKNKRRTLEENVTLIQKFWRGYQIRKAFKAHKRKMAHERALKAIEELEILRKEAIKEELYMEEPRPKTNNYQNFRSVAQRNVGTAYQSHRVPINH